MCENNENTVVPDDADEDIPFPGGPSSEDVSEGDGNRRKTIENVPKTQGIDPEKQHNWWIENLKNIAALGIVAFCLITIAVFAIHTGHRRGTSGPAHARGCSVWPRMGDDGL